MTTAFKPEKKNDFTRIAYEEIKKAIINNELKPRDHLNVPYLAKVLGMSRTPISKALKMLEQDGLVESGSIGVHVKQMTLKELYDVTEVRTTLECQALRSSLPNITEGEINALADRLLAMQSTLNSGGIVECQTLNEFDQDLHSLITEKSNNAFLINIRQSISQVTSRYFRLLVDSYNQEDIAKVIENNLALINALKTRDEDRIFELFYEHIQNGTVELADLLQKHGYV
ncbi:MAG: GntR family transcriptional regulator [Clostridiales bacterium]